MLKIIRLIINMSSSIPPEYSCRCVAGCSRVLPIYHWWQDAWHWEWHIWGAQLCRLSSPKLTVWPELLALSTVRPMWHQLYVMQRTKCELWQTLSGRISTIGFSVPVNGLMIQISNPLLLGLSVQKKNWKSRWKSCSYLRLHWLLSKKWKLSFFSLSHSNAYHQNQHNCVIMNIQFGQYSYLCFLNI